MNRVLFFEFKSWHGHHIEFKSQFKVSEFKSEFNSELELNVSEFNKSEFNLNSR